MTRIPYTSKLSCSFCAYTMRLISGAWHWHNPKTAEAGLKLICFVGR